MVTIEIAMVFATDADGAGVELSDSMSRAAAGRRIEIAFRTDTGIESTMMMMARAFGKKAEPSSSKGEVLIFPASIRTTTIASMRASEKTRSQNGRLFNNSLIVLALCAIDIYRAGLVLAIRPSSPGWPAVREAATVRRDILPDPLRSGRDRWSRVPP